MLPGTDAESARTRDSEYLNVMVHAPATRAKLCADETPKCLLQSRPSCESKSCSNLATAFIFPFIALGIGIFLQPVLKCLGFKQYYLLCLLAFGCALGGIACRVNLGLLTISLQQWVHMNPPNLFFYVFLAPIIFEGAFNMRWHTFRRFIVHILLTGVVYVVIQAVIIGVVAKWINRDVTGWNWAASFMFGGLLSATDPTPVVEALKHSGVSENLITVIDGEGLINDVSSLIWDIALQDLLASYDTVYRKQNALSVSIYLFRSFIGGVLMGAIFAVSVLLILNLVHDEFEVETSLTILTAFAGFWVVQAPLTSSGVICNAVAGLLLSYLGRSLITESVRNSVAEFWRMIRWLANTIVFVHSGVLAIAFVWPCDASNLKSKDYGLIFVFFAFAVIIRVAVFVGLSRVFFSKQKFFQWREWLINGMSGTRGAVCLILAMIVATAEPLPADLRSRVFVWTTGIVGLSLIVKGILIPYLIGWLKLDNSDTTREDFLSQVRAIMTQFTLTSLDKLCADSTYSGARWSYVRKVVLPSKWLEDDETGYHFNRAIHDLEETIGPRRPSLQQILDEHEHSLERPNLLHDWEHQEKQWIMLSYPAATELKAPPRTERENEGFPRVSTMETLRDILTFNSEVSQSVRPMVPFDFAQGLSYSEWKRTFRPPVDQHSSQEMPSPDDFSRKLASELENMKHRERDSLANMNSRGESDREYRERRRRVLLYMRKQIHRYASNIFLQYTSLLHLEYKINKTIYDNDDGSECSMLSFLEWDRNKTESCFSWFQQHNSDGKYISLVFVVLDMAADVLRQDTMRRSKKVIMEVQNLYEAAAFIRTELERENLESLSWVVSQFAIQTIIKRQNVMLDELLDQGICDELEYDILLEELQSKRRFYTARAGRKWKKGSEEIASLAIWENHPLTSALVSETGTDQYPAVSLAPGKELTLERGSIAIVIKGSLIPVAKLSRKTSFLSAPGAESESVRLVPAHGTTIGHNGNRHHWCSSRFSCYAPPDLICNMNNAPYSPCQTATDHLHETIFMGSGSSRATLLYTISKEDVEYVSERSKNFRDELTRYLTHDMVLETLQKEKPYQLRLCNDALDGKLDENTWVGRAFALLEKLPYMTVVRIHADGDTEIHGNYHKQVTFQGPGFLINGSVRVSQQETGIPGSPVTLLHELLEGPALLPAKTLIVQEAASSSKSNNGLENSSPLFDRVVAHVLINAWDTHAEKACARLKRWSGDDGKVDMNCRFGMTSHVSPPLCEESDASSARDDGIV